MWLWNYSAYIFSNEGSSLKRNSFNSSRSMALSSRVDELANMSDIWWSKTLKKGSRSKIRNVLPGFELWDRLVKWRQDDVDIPLDFASGKQDHHPLRVTSRRRHLCSKKPVELPNFVFWKIQESGWVLVEQFITHYFAGPLHLLWP